MNSWIAYKNGSWLPRTNATLHLHDAGVVYGAIITDRFRTWGGELHFLYQHRERFWNNCQSIGILPTFDFSAITDELIQRNKAHFLNHDIAIVWLSTPGLVGSMIGEVVPQDPTVIAYGYPLLLQRFLPWLQEGVSLRLHCATIHSSGLSPQIKHRSRFAWWLAQEQLQQQFPQEQALFIDPVHKAIRETAFANFICLVDGAIWSPPADSILPGIMLSVVRKICGDHQIDWIERDFTLAEIHNRAQAALLCNSTFGILPVSSINGVQLDQQMDSWLPVYHSLCNTLNFDPWSQIRQLG